MIMTNVCSMYEVNCVWFVMVFVITHIAAELGSGCHEDSDGYDTDEEIRR